MRSSRKKRRPGISAGSTWFEAWSVGCGVWGLRCGREDFGV